MYFWVLNHLTRTTKLVSLTSLIPSMFLRQLIFFTLCSLVFSLTGYNQNPYFHIQSLTEFKDLERNDFLFKDREGYVWVSTMSGLDRYNGLDFHSYPTGKATLGNIKGEYIQGNLIEDQYGDIWFATYEAINRYNRLSDDFSAFQVCNTAGDNIKQQYHVFHIDNETDEIWLLAGEEIFCLDLRQPSQYCRLPYTTGGRRFSYKRNATNNTCAIYAFPWASGPGFELFTSDGKGNWSHYIDSLDTFGKPQITQGIIENDSIIWMTSRKGLIRFNQKTKYSSLFKADEDSTGIANGLFLQENQLLLSAKENGLFIFDTQKDSFITHIQKNDINKILSNSPSEIYQDEEQQIWISHDGYGVDKMSINHKTGFKVFPNDKNVQVMGEIKHIITGKNNSFIALTQKGLFPVCKEEQGYYFKNKKANTIKNLETGSCEQDKQERIWLASPDAVYLHNGITTRKLKQFDDRQLYFMYNLSSGKNFITSSTAFMEINAAGQTSQVKNSATLPDKTEASYHRLFEHSTGKIMLSINANLLAVCSYEADSLKFEKLLDIGADIFSFYENKATGTIWMGTSKGVAQVDTAGTVNFLLQEDWEIGATNIYAVIEDNNNRLWITSGNGLWSYNLNEKKLNRYRKEDGLCSESFSMDAYLKNDDGTIWLGTNNGLLYFYPDSIKLPPSKTIVQIEKAWINDGLYEGERSIAQTRKLDLAYNQTTLAFKLNVLDYIYPTYNKLRYRLKGYDDKWKMATNGQIIKFTKIPAGKHYKLEVIGMNAHYRESPLKTLDIKIATPFWQTWWFLLLVTVSGGLTVWGITRGYMNRKLREQLIILDRKKALEEQRKALADDLHDNVGNDLSEILHISDLATLKEPNEMKKEFEKIAELTTDSIMNMRFMINILETEIDTITGLLRILREYSNRLFTRHELNCKINFPEEIPGYKIEGRFKWTFSLFFKECLGNIIKHAQASQVELSVYFEQDTMCIEVKDNGIGFDITEQSGKGKGLFTMKKRAEFLEGTVQINAMLDRGTSVCLNIPLTDKKILHITKVT